MKRIVSAIFPSFTEMIRALPAFSSPRPIISQTSTGLAPQSIPRPLPKEEAGNKQKRLLPADFRERMSQLPAEAEQLPASKTIYINRQLARR
jgi:hypothetical protein